MLHRCFGGKKPNATPPSNSMIPGPKPSAFPAKSKVGSSVPIELWGRAMRHILIAMISSQQEWMSPKTPVNSGKIVTSHRIFVNLQEVPSLEQSYSQHSDICAPRRRSSMSATCVHHLGRALEKTGAKPMPFWITSLTLPQFLSKTIWQWRLWNRPLRQGPLPKLACLEIAVSPHIGGSFWQLLLHHSTDWNNWRKLT